LSRDPATPRLRPRHQALNNLACSVDLALMSTPPAAAAQSDRNIFDLRANDDSLPRLHGTVVLFLFSASVVLLGVLAVLCVATAHSERIHQLELCAATTAVLL